MISRIQLAADMTQTSRISLRRAAALAVALALMCGAFSFASNAVATAAGGGGGGGGGGMGGGGGTGADGTFTFSSKQMTSSVVLDVTFRGSMKLAGAHLPVSRWVRDVTKIVAVG